MKRIGLLVAAALIAGAGLQQAYAQSGNTPAQKSEKAEKKKSTEKKDAAKQTGTQGNNAQTAPMSGYRPDPVINY